MVFEGSKSQDPGRTFWSKPLFAAMPPRGPQEAPKRPSKSQNLRMVLTVSSFLEWTIFGIRYSGFCTFGSKTRVSGIKNLYFHICFTMVSAHGHAILFGRISEAAFLCLFLALLPLQCIFKNELLETLSCIQNH